LAPGTPWRIKVTLLLRHNFAIINSPVTTKNLHNNTHNPQILSLQNAVRSLRILLSLEPPSPPGRSSQQRQFNIFLRTADFHFRRRTSNLHPYFLRRREHLSHQYFPFPSQPSKKKIKLTNKQDNDLSVNLIAPGDFPAFYECNFYTNTASTLVLTGTSAAGSDIQVGPPQPITGVACMPTGANGACLPDYGEFTLRNKGKRESKLTRCSDL